MGEGNPIKDRGGEWDRAEKQRAQQVGSDEHRLARESIDPNSSELADQCPGNEIDCGESGSFRRIDAEADDGKEREGGSGDE